MIERIEYGLELTVDEVQTRYEEVRSEFERVKSRYSGFFSIWKRKMNEEDQTSLTECTGVLLPLSTVPVVQEQVLHGEGNLHSEISQLNWRILDYLAGFKNTGIERIPAHM